MMRQKWIRFGCFVTGYNPAILSGCSESSLRRVMRYTSAMVIICILWAFIGYTFASRYLKAEWFYALLGSLIAVVIVVQIERQVILSSSTNKVPMYLRAFIAILMAIIGSIIIDQILFQDDIEEQKMIMLNEKVKRVVSAKSAELRHQISSIDSVIIAKENERKVLVNDISNNPIITSFSKQVTQQGPKGNKTDSLKQETTIRKSESIPNPKIDLLHPLDAQIASLRREKNKKDSMLLVIQPAIEKEFMQKVGFLDELNLMIEIFKQSVVALIVWGIWFSLLFGLEIFILVSKWNETEIDYDKMIEQQMKLHYKRIELLGKQ